MNDHLIITLTNGISIGLHDSDPDFFPKRFKDYGSGEPFFISADGDEWIFAPGSISFIRRTTKEHYDKMRSAAEE